MLTNELGVFIQDMIGKNQIAYLGIQEGYKSIPGFLMFHDRITETSICCRGLKEMIHNLEKSRRNFGLTYNFIESKVI